MDIYIEDTGLVETTVTSTTNRFTAYSSASTDEKKNGEFRVEGALVLKVNSIQLGESINQVRTPSLFTLENKNLRTSNSNLRFTLSGHAKKSLQQKYSDSDIVANTNNILEDLPDLKKIMLLTLTKGHKDLYIKDSSSTEIEKLFWLYYIIELFGKTDAGNSQSKKHINIIPVSFSGNEGISSQTITWNMVFDIDFNLN